MNDSSFSLFYFLYNFGLLIEFLVSGMFYYGIFLSKEYFSRNIKEKNKEKCWDIK